jgi:hypothetical protein
MRFRPLVCCQDGPQRAAIYVPSLQHELNPGESLFLSKSAEYPLTYKGPESGLNPKIEMKNKVKGKYSILNRK